MNEPSRPPSIDWEGKGYFEFLTQPKTSMPPEWPRWLEMLREAAAGYFSGLPQLLDIARHTGDEVLLQSCYYLLGDTLSGQLADSLKEEARTTNNFWIMLECCDAIGHRGWLADIPLLLELFSRHTDKRDAVMIPIYISDCLSTRPGELPTLNDCDDFEEFQEIVLQRYQAVVDELGTSSILVFKGKRFGVQRLAAWILDELRRPHFRMDWRRRFESATGIDCSAFYRDQELQPLAAAAILEDFLESPDAANYEDGVRYFFGHRIPD